MNAETITLNQFVRVKGHGIAQVIATLKDTANCCFAGMILVRFILPNGKLSGMRHAIAPDRIEELTIDDVVDVAMMAAGNQLAKRRARNQGRN